MLLIMFKIMLVAYPFVKELIFKRTDVLTVMRNNRVTSMLSLVAIILLMGFVFVIDISISLYDQLEQQKAMVVQLEKKLDAAIEVSDRKTPDTVAFVGRLARMEESLSVLEEELQTVTKERDDLRERLRDQGSGKPPTTTRHPERTLRDILRDIRKAEKAK